MNPKRPRPLPVVMSEVLAQVADGDLSSFNKLAQEVALRTHQREDRNQLTTSPQRGDWIKIRQGLLGLTTHHGVYFSDDDVVHATVKRGVIRSSLAKFQQGRPLYLVRACMPGELDKLTERASAVVGNPYHPGQANCEHVASFIQTGDSVSFQAEVGGATVLMFRAWLRSKRPIIKSGIR